jgi:glucan phosphoethanolaminetransferase (alkaline phosphatase superfamily)
MDIIVLDEIYYCDSTYRHKILPLIYFYKSLFLVMGGYLAAKTRHVHIAALNDSKFIVWSIYIVVLTSLFTFIVMISLKNSGTYVAICLVVIIMTSSILCLIFLPKLFKLKKNRHKSLHDIISKDLILDNSRTRRLIVEIGYFEQYRYAQLQNRELKTELIRVRIFFFFEGKKNDFIFI